ncbi:hypothetical protein QUF72_01450 [Desulfobacterales bacterium HSG2]|nr:hypothetical protein [Desulfobacterales bacterium HSG2]
MGATEPPDLATRRELLGTIRRILQSGVSFLGTARTRSVRIAKSKPPNLATQRELSWEPPKPPDLAIRQELFGNHPNRRIWQSGASFLETTEPPDLAIRRELFGSPNRRI